MTPGRVAASILLLGVLFSTGVLAGTRAVPAETYKAGETFDAVFKIVKDSHFDPAFDVAKWEQLGADLRPKAIEAKTPGEFRAVLSDMLGRLGLSHFAVIPSTPDSPGDKVNHNGQPGFDVRLIDRRLVVSSVDPDGGAAAAGVLPGWIVQSIGGTPVSAILARIPEATPPRLAQLEAWRLCHHATARIVRTRTRRSVSWTRPAQPSRRASSGSTSRESRSPSAAFPRCTSASRRR